MVMQQQQQRVLPKMPKIGLAESAYSKLAREADRAGDAHSHEAAKVGQYVSLAMDPQLGWDEKVKYFRHALRRHCNAPPLPGEEVWLFYRNLAGVVRSHVGLEALRLASTEDDLYAARISMGQDREVIEREAERFFSLLMDGARADLCPEWFNEDDWAQLKMIRDQWI